MSEELADYKGTAGRGAKKAKPIETGDMTAIMQLTIDSCVSRVGRPAEFPSTREGLDSFVTKTIEFFDYVRMINENPDLKQKLIPDIENWAVYLGITRQTLFNYQRRGGEWADTIEYFKGAIASVKKQLALNYKIPPVLAIFDFTNNHGYLNSSEFKVVSDTEPRNTENEEARLENEIRAAGLVWDEATKEFVPEYGGKDDT